MLGYFEDIYMYINRIESEQGVVGSGMSISCKNVVLRAQHVLTGLHH